MPPALMRMSTDGALSNSNHSCGSPATTTSCSDDMDTTMMSSASLNVLLNGRSPLVYAEEPSSGTTTALPSQMMMIAYYQPQPPMEPRQQNHPAQLQQQQQPPYQRVPNQRCVSDQDTWISALSTEEEEEEDKDGQQDDNNEDEKDQNQEQADPTTVFHDIRCCTTEPSNRNNKASAARALSAKVPALHITQQQPQQQQQQQQPQQERVITDVAQQPSEDTNSEDTASAVTDHQVEQDHRHMDAPDFTSILAGPHHHGGSEETDSGDSISTISATAAPTIHSKPPCCKDDDDDDKDSEDSHCATVHDMTTTTKRTTKNRMRRHVSNDVTSILHGADLNDSVSTMTSHGRHADHILAAAQARAQTEHGDVPSSSSSSDESASTVLTMGDDGPSVSMRRDHDTVPVHYLRDMPEVDAATFSGMLVGLHPDSEDVSALADDTVLVAARPALAATAKAHSLTSIHCHSQGEDDDVSAMTPRSRHNKNTTTIAPASSIVWDHNATDEVSAISGTIWGSAATAIDPSKIRAVVPNSIVAGDDCDVSAMTGDHLSSWRPGSVVAASQPSQQEHPQPQQEQEPNSLTLATNYSTMVVTPDDDRPPTEIMSGGHAAAAASVSSVGMTSTRINKSPRIRKRDRYLNTRLTRPKNYLQSILEGDEAPSSFIPREPHTDHSIDKQVEYLERNVKHLEAMHQHVAGTPQNPVHRALVGGDSSSNQSRGSSASGSVKTGGSRNDSAAAANSGNVHSNSSHSKSRNNHKSDTLESHKHTSSSASSGKKTSQRRFSIKGLFRGGRTSISKNDSNHKKGSATNKSNGKSSSRNKKQSSQRKNHASDKHWTTSHGNPKTVGDLEEMYVLSRQFDEKARLLAQERSKRERQAQQRRLHASPILAPVLRLTSGDSMNPASRDEVAYLDPVTVMRQQARLQQLLEDYRNSK